jgi:hypothetical protein
VEYFLPESGVLCEVLRGVAEEAPYLRAHVVYGAGVFQAISGVDDRGYLLYQRPVLVLYLLESGLDPNAVRDVAGDGYYLA